jgi:hypothetical protein
MKGYGFLYLITERDEYFEKLGDLEDMIYDMRKDNLKHGPDMLEELHGYVSTIKTIADSCYKKIEEFWKHHERLMQVYEYYKLGQYGIEETIEEIEKLKDDYL